jgi:hypothetical protein
MNPAHVLLPHLCNIYFNILPPAPKSSKCYPSFFGPKFCMNLVSLPYTLWISPCLDFIVLVTVREEYKFRGFWWSDFLRPPILLYFLPLRFRCSLEHPVFKHSQFMFFDRLNFTLTQIIGNIVVLCRSVLILRVRDGLVGYHFIFYNFMHIAVFFENFSFCQNNICVSLFGCLKRRKVLQWGIMIWTK